jgi:nitrate reductase gamma subunit
MESLLEWARGPFFIFAFIFMVLGLLRHIVVTVWEVIRMMRRAGDKVLPYRQIFITTIKWLVPVGKMKGRFLFSITSVIFHISIIIVPIFLGGHILLWARGVGISWPAIPNHVADVFTMIAIITALTLVIQRISAKATRALSRFQDYALPLLVAIPFATGLFVMHPSINPFSYELMLLIHVMSANLIFILIPITKLSHMVLMPGVQLVSEVAWHWPPDAGSKLAVTLGKEKEPV